MSVTPLQTPEVAIPEPGRRQEELAHQLAQDQRAVYKNSQAWVVLTRHLHTWEETLQQAYQQFRSASLKDPDYSRAGEWILDNFYVIQQTFRQIEEGLPASFIHQLPKLDGTPLKGQPRIFALAGAWVEYNQSQIDLAQTTAFVQAYQQVTQLTIGELWALPIMLRIEIMEQLTLAAAQLTGLEPPDRAGTVTTLARESGTSTSEPGETPVQPDPAALPNETIVSNCFLSLRALLTTDWKDYFEQISRVEQILRDDPAGIYARMDFETRNSYRSIIEELARRSSFTEEQVAQAAIQFAQNANDSPPTRKTHVGYYLREAGRANLEKDLGYQPGLSMRLQRALLTHPTAIYLGSISSLTALFLLGLLAYVILTGGGLVQILLAGLLGIGLALEAAVALVNWNVTHRVKPQRLPRMDFSEGIPPGFRTMVVVPSLLESAAEINHLLQGLELYYLSNPDPQLTYALLTDFGDAFQKDMPEDENLLRLAKAGIEKLNQKYAPAAPFYLFHRQRQWNPSEGVWMGWERKRGKLADFNRLLLNLGETAYTTQVGDVELIRESASSSEPGIKYVITLDADTSLPQGSANRLVATLAHPLNQAVFSADGRSVVAGYSVLQPRVGIKPTSANRSLFSQIFSGSSGFDLYSFAVSDVYQDLFGEGSYVGKGIYDVAAFERSLAGQVRQNTLLSHDLFEGIHGRAALVTDIVLYEDMPWRMLVYSRRLRRWIRGDWQLLPWLFPIVRTQAGWSRNRLSVINLWKIFDNLRRSLLPPAMLALLVAGWLFLPGSALVWTLLVLLPSALPLAAQAARPGAPDNRHLTLKQRLEPALLPAIRWILEILFLPYEAFVMLSAIGITIERLLILRKHMLEWATAADLARSFRNSRLRTWLEMAVSLAFSLLLGIATWMINPSALPVAAPLLVGWLISPQVAYWISQPITHVPASLSETQRRQVQRLARRTWAFFERYVGPEDHWLPPDHFQESPRGNVTHLTTPTNIGLFLLSALSAYDFGYVSLPELAVRLRSTLESMEGLEHYRGHLLNWYDSQTLAALPPHYISTVDSGNLAACLIALKQGCLAMKDARVPGARQWRGLLVILDILSEILHKLGTNQPHEQAKSRAFLPEWGASVVSIEAELANIYERIRAIQDQPSAWSQTLAWLSGEGWERVSRHLMELLDSHPNLNPESLAELQLYLNLMLHHLQDLRRGLDLFAPWLGRLEAIPAAFIDMPAWQEFLGSLPAESPRLAQAEASYERIQAALEHLKAQLPQEGLPLPARSLNAWSGREENASEWIQNLQDGLSAARLSAKSLLVDFQELAGLAEAAVTGMDFHFLFSDRSQVFHIGYNASTEQLDPSYYDLLASEARITSLVAIAKRDVPQSHWQHLGRPVTIVNGRQVLLSWSGTMFEYLMPTLFTKNYPGTFLSDSCRAALEAQIRYGQEHKVPWGISESGYYAFDVNQNYQYRAFGVPDLGYKRDLPGDMVIAPYASLLGLSLKPQAVLENMAHLAQLDMLGRYGFYEALDYTRTRLPAGHEHAVVKSIMAHHQGMILLAACNYLMKDLMVQRFHADERIRSVELLLQEKIPLYASIEYPHPEQPEDLPRRIRPVDTSPWRVPVDSLVPQVHVLAQAGTSVMITNAGGGYSQWREFALTRWQADSSLDGWGSWIYLQDLENGALWSATCQPVIGGPGQGLVQYPGRDLEVLFYPHKVEFQRSDNGISLHTNVTVSPDGVEIRQVNILNDSDRPRRLKLTSYGEVVLAPQAVDRQHPAFNKLFIESEYLPEENALLFHHRPRAAEEKPVVLLHALRIEAGRTVTGEHTSQRAQLLGRTRSPGEPLKLLNGSPLPAGTPRVLEPRLPRPVQASSRRSSGEPGLPTGTPDPIFSLAQEIDLKPHAKTRLNFLTLAAPSRQEALEKLSHYQIGLAFYHAFEEANALGEEELINLGLNSSGVENIQRILSALLYPVGILRAEPHILAQNELGQSGLWAFGISGDYPILLVHIRDGKSTLLTEALQAFIYWRSRHVTVNLVILNEQDTAYNLELHNAIHRQVVRMGADNWLDQRDGIFVLRSDQLQPAQKILFQTVAGVILDESRGSLAEHARRFDTQPVRLPEFTPSLAPPTDSEPTPALPPPGNLLMDNGLGGFSRDGREYVIHLNPGQHTPHPWVNVIANPQFGCLVSEAGSGCTWAVNSAENRLTPWRNDPVTDLPGEALYLRDEETGLVWSPTLLPTGADGLHIIRHGAGYSTFESQSHGLNQFLRLFVAPDAPVKIVQLRLKNLWQRPRRLTASYYAEWVLGTTREAYQAHILPEFDPDKNALLASNRYNSEFSERVAFLAANKKPHGVTADRAEFLGRLGSLQFPAALGRIGLGSAVNAGLDPCAAIQLHIELAPGEEEEIFFLIGQGGSRDESLALIGQLQAKGALELLWQKVRQHWDDLLDAIKVATPDPGMDLILNRWLLYQAVSCRLWGRTALYQSSGAFGFRDQLQDVLAVLQIRPALAREQILNAARRQFEAGDVLHWWHPPSGRGVRTRFSDDLLWLPFVTAEYVTASGDAAILDEKIPFLEAEPLKPQEAERYDLYESGAESDTLYEHCRRAIRKASTSGAHGLPLMGAGDWNDGMNRVGAAGRGESVWLGWFLHATLTRFSRLCELVKDDPQPYRQQADQLARDLELHAWDGLWYLRAFYDDGSRLGSSQNSECRIDSIAQSWAVISQAADPQRAARAMESVNRQLVREADQMILLLAPPFDKTPHDPGYIKGYPPGVRENGGQYTHAAVWTAWAFAMLGQGERAEALFRLLNPVHHADSPEKANHYMVEPYGIAADIYSHPPLTGTGGWTGYTGSASWMYRLGLEAILGLTRSGDNLNFNPCIPGAWPGFKVEYRFGTAHYQVSVENPQSVQRGVQQVWLDGNPLPGASVPLTDDGQQHAVRVLMGSVPAG